MNRTAAANGPAAPAVRPDPQYSVLEKLVINGDLEALTPEQRIQWYYLRCEAAGLDPRTQPFQYVQMKRGGLKLYATKAASDQLIANRKLDVKVISREYNSSLYTYEVAARVKTLDGQETDDVGVVSLDGLAGEDLANAMMKCVTKAKRRTVLSACGLGMLDETEVETIPDARVVRPAQSSLPSPRPLPADAPASHQELVAATPEPTAAQPVPSSDCGRWIQTRVDEVNAEWSMMCVQARKPYKKLCNRFQCVNGIVTSWLESDPPRLYPEAVEIDGKRDNAKVADVLKEMWESEERDIVKFDVNSYLDLKLEEATRAAGINMDAQPPEEALSNG